MVTCTYSMGATLHVIITAMWDKQRHEACAILLSKCSKSCTSLRKSCSYALSTSSLPHPYIEMLSHFQIFHNLITSLPQNLNDPNILATWRQVEFTEDFFDIIKDVHCRQKGHIGSKKTVEEVELWHTVDTTCSTSLTYVVSDIKDIWVPAKVCCGQICRALSDLPCKEASIKQSSSKTHHFLWVYDKRAGRF